MWYVLIIIAYKGKVNEFMAKVNESHITHLFYLKGIKVNTQTFLAFKYICSIKRVR